MLNRAALLVRPLQPFHDWLLAVDSQLTAENLPLSVLHAENTVYLMSLEDADQFEEWLEANYRPIFEAELRSWFEDPACWPERRDYVQFQNWLTVELHSVVIDLATDEPLEEDGEE